MYKKITSLIMVLLLAAMVFTGCGEKNEDSKAEEQQKQSTGKEQVTLKVWGAEEDSELLAQIFESFKQKYSSEATFNITFEAESEASCKDRLLTDIEGGADVFAFADDQLRTLVSAGAIAKIPNADEIKSANSQSSVEASSVNGILYAYPMTADNGYFMYYNKEFFSEEDLKTLDGMLDVAERNEKKITMDWGSGWYLYSFFGCTGLSVGLNLDGYTNYCDWNSTDNEIKGVDVAEAMIAIAKKTGFYNGGDGSLIDGAKDGSVIAGVSGVWNATTLQEIWGENYGAVKLPTYTCAGKQVQMGSFAGYKMVGANDYSKYKEWALKLAEWITNESNQTLRFVQRGQGPSNLNSATSPEVSQSLAIQAVLAQSDYASLQRIGNTYWNPTGDFGNRMANQNVEGKPLQEILDDMVSKITATGN